MHWTLPDWKCRQKIGFLNKLVILHPDLVSSLRICTCIHSFLNILEWLKRGSPEHAIPTVTKMMRSKQVSQLNEHRQGEELGGGGGETERRGGYRRP